LLKSLSIIADISSKKGSEAPYLLYLMNFLLSLTVRDYISAIMYSNILGETTSNTNRSLRLKSSCNSSHD